MMVEDIAVEVLNNFKDEELLDLSGLKEYNSISWTAELVYAVEDAMGKYYPDLEEPEEIDVKIELPPPNRGGGFSSYEFS